MMVRGEYSEKTIWFPSLRGVHLCLIRKDSSEDSGEGVRPEKSRFRRISVKEDSPTRGVPVGYWQVYEFIRMDILWMTTRWNREGQSLLLIESD
jgi:hypothetical protein